MAPTNFTRPFIFVLFFALPLSARPQEKPASQPGFPTLSIEEGQAVQNPIEQFYNAKDADAAMRSWSAKSPFREERLKRIQRFYATNKDIVAGKLEVRQVENDQSDLVLRISIDLKTSDPKTGKPGPGTGTEERVFTVRKEDGSWKIWRMQNASDVLANRIVDARSDASREALIQSDSYLPPELLKLALFNLAGSLRSKGNLAAARTGFNSMQRVAERSGDKAGTSSALINIGIVSDMQGQHREALQYYDRALEIAESIGDTKQISSALADMGIADEELGDYSEALAIYKRSLVIAESTHDKLNMASTLANIGEVYRKQGNSAVALEYFQKALDLDVKEKHDPAEIAQTLNNIGTVYQDMGNGARALDYFQQSLDQLSISQDARATMAILSNIGDVYQAQGAYQEALDYYEKSMALTKQLADKDTEAAVTLSIGTLQQLLERYPEAMDSFNKSLALNEQTGAKAGVVDALDRIGGLEARQEKYSEALATHRKALALAEPLGLQSSIGLLCTKMAEEHFRLGEFKQQLEYAQRATTLAREINNPSILWQSRTLEGLAYQRGNELAKARQAFEEAIGVTEDLRNQVAGAEEAQQSSFSAVLAPYHHLVELLVSQGAIEEALQYAELAKGRVLLDVMASGRVNVSGAMTADERERESQIRAELVSLNRQLQIESSAVNRDIPRTNDLTARLEKARVNYREFQTTVYTAHPELKTQRGHMEPMTASDAAALLPDNQSAFLEFLVADRNTFLFVITKGSGRAGHRTAAVYTIPVAAPDLEKKAEGFRGQLAERNLGYRKTAQDLYALLLAPARSQLSGKTRILIIPDGPLWSLPFQALEAAPGRPMIELSAIAYTPSITVLREMQRIHPNHPSLATTEQKTLLAMGDPALQERAVRTASFAYRGGKFGPLPEAAAEVKALGLVYGRENSEIQTGLEAGEDKFKAEAGEFQVLHLATHGIFNDASPMYSHVLLSPGDSKSKEDGLLEAWEVMQMDLKAKLVVLSACETARGHFSAGEGVIGLTWSFFVAGVPTAVVSQWKVESASTSKLMVSFHQKLKTGTNHSGPQFATAKALQEAQLELLHNPQYAHPFYWAGFVVVGDPR